jgi:hypothetical protein
MIGGPIKNAQNAAKEAFKGVEAAQREVIESMMRSPEAFKDVTPEQREQMEKMMRSRMSQAGPNAMDEAFKDLPAGQREAMRRSMMPPAGPKSEGCVETLKEIRKTGKQPTIAGYPSVNYEVLADGKPESEVWIAKTITAFKELDPKKLERLMIEVIEAVGCGQGRRAGLYRPILGTEGYTVKSVDPGIGTMEVTKAEKRAIPASEFQPPAGFRRKELSEMRGSGARHS